MTGITLCPVKHLSAPPVRILPWVHTRPMVSQDGVLCLTMPAVSTSLTLSMISCFILFLISLRIPVIWNITNITSLAPRHHLAVCACRRAMPNGSMTTVRLAPLWNSMMMRTIPVPLASRISRRLIQAVPTEDGIRQIPILIIPGQSKRACALFYCSSFFHVSGTRSPSI